MIEQINTNYTRQWHQYSKTLNSSICRLISRMNRKYLTEWVFRRRRKKNETDWMIRKMSIQMIWTSHSTTFSDGVNVNFTCIMINPWQQECNWRNVGKKERSMWIEYYFVFLFWIQRDNMADRTRVPNMLDTFMYYQQNRTPPFPGSESLRLFEW